MKLKKHTPNATAFRDGTRVRNIGHQFANNVPNGMEGTVDNPKASFLRAKGFTYVDWDNGQYRGVFTRELERIK